MLSICVCTSRYVRHQRQCTTFLCCVTFCSLTIFRGPRFDDYISHSRNMHVVKDPGTLFMRYVIFCCNECLKGLVDYSYILAKRRSSLKQGRIDIVHFLRGLPRTTHHSKTFSVDVIRATVESVWRTCVYACPVSIHTHTLIETNKTCIFAACWNCFCRLWSV